MQIYKKIFGFSRLAMIFLAVCSISLNIFLVTVPCKAQDESTLYVGGTGAGNYTNIQDAIDNSLDNDTIYIHSGTYNESIVVNKSVGLIGSNMRDVFINGNSSLYVVLIRSSRVNISGFTIQNGAVGIFVSGLEYSFNNFSDNILIDNREGIRLVSSSSNKITNNTIQNHSNFGIGFYESSCNLISGNHLVDNEKAICFNRWSDNNVIWKNNFTENYFSITLDFSFNSLISENWITNGSYGVYLTNSNNNNVTDNNIEYNDMYGIYMSDSDNNVISPNFFLNNYEDVKRNSNPPKITMPGFEFLLFVCATFFVIFVRKKILQ